MSCRFNEASRGTQTLRRTQKPRAAKTEANTTEVKNITITYT